MLLLNDRNSACFHELIEKASKNYTTMLVTKGTDFDLQWRKQILYFMLASFAFHKSSKPPKTTLNCIFSA